MSAKDFNEKYQVGQNFTYFSAEGKSKPICVKTTSMAWEENNVTVVNIEGKKGSVPVSRFKECE